MARISKQAQADEWYKQNKDQIDWNIKSNRERFRETSWWKKFSKHLKNIHKRCEFCSCSSKNLNVHHIFPKNYDILEEDKFKVVCFSCHTKIEQLSRRKDRSTIPEYFLPFLENFD